MKTTLALALVAPTLLVAADTPPHMRRWGGPGGPGGWGPGGFGAGYGGPFGGGGSGCASSCVASFWATATPTPTAFCDNNAGLQSCISSACTAQAAEYTSYSSKRASLCSAYSSCSSTGTYTYTFTTPDGSWGGGNWGGGARNWPTGEVTYTGCPWNGDGWGFPFWGGIGMGRDFWATAGPGWTRETITTTVTGAGVTGTGAAIVTLEKAVSGDVSTIRTLSGAEATGGANAPGAAPPASDVSAVKVMGAALGAVMAVVGLM